MSPSLLTARDILLAQKRLLYTEIACFDQDIALALARPSAQIAAAHDARDDALATLVSIIDALNLLDAA